jgi:hypothetical protein
MICYGGGGIYENIRTRTEEGEGEGWVGGVERGDRTNHSLVCLDWSHL